MSKPILCVNTGIVYRSLAEASRQLDIHISQISHQIAGERVTANGLVFYPLKGTETKKEIEKIIAAEIKSHYKISVDLIAKLKGGESDA